MRTNGVLKGKCPWCRIKEFTCNNTNEEKEKQKRQRAGKDGYCTQRTRRDTQERGMWPGTSETNYTELRVSA